MAGSAGAVPPPSDDGHRVANPYQYTVVALREGMIGGKMSGDSRRTSPVLPVKIERTFRSRNSHAACKSERKRSKRLVSSLRQRSLCARTRPALEAAHIPPKSQTHDGTRSQRARSSVN
jgi:hypothetical protein